MTTKEELQKNFIINSRRGFLDSSLKLTGVFLVIGFIASYFGLTTLSTDLRSISNNPLIAQVTFIGFIITINERVIEAFKRTYRRYTANELMIDLNLAIEESENNPLDLDLKKKVRLWQSIVNDYSAETGRLCLSLSLAIGCILASIGAVRVLGGIENSPQFSSQIHIMLFDSVDVLLTGWLIAGGSEGWTNFLYGASGMFPKSSSKKDKVSG